MSITYADSGVDRDKGDLFVQRIEKMVRTTYNKAVKSGVGGFASLYEIGKGRYLAAQILAMLEGGIWLRNARAANEAAARLAAAAGPDRLLYPVEANEMFVRVTAEEAAALRAQGFDFYDWGPDEARLVTSWDSDPDQVDALAAAIRAL